MKLKTIHVEFDVGEEDSIQDVTYSRRLCVLDAEKSATGPIPPILKLFFNCMVWAYHLIVFREVMKSRRDPTIYSHCRNDVLEIMKHNGMLS